MLSAKEAREPRVPVGISDRTFELVDQHLNSIGYDGMTALSCDDTKLTPASRIYWDAEKKAYFVVGESNQSKSLLPNRIWLLAHI